LRNIKNFHAKIALDRLPMLIVRSTCKRGKIIPLWGTKLLLKSKGKRKRKEKNLKTKGSFEKWN
jgi:hypothetical protein